MNKRSLHRPLFSLLPWTLMLCLAYPSRGQDLREGYIQAPPNHAVLSDTLNGWYFVPVELKKEFDATLGRLEALQAEIDFGRIEPQAAAEELASLKSRLQELRDRLMETRQHVAGLAVHEQTDSLEFELGPEKRLAITANHVRVVGWPGPTVKVELKKMVLAADDDKSVADHLAAIKVVHEHGRAQFAGQTDAEREAHEIVFQAEHGASMTPEQREGRRKLLAEIRSSHAVHRDLLEKQVDQISVTGLEFENNRMIEKKVNSDGGDGRSGSVRQRYAELTVYVPSCTSVCVRGARRGLQVENLNTLSLTIVDEDSTDSDARGRFEIKGLRGDLVCRNFPLQLMQDVDGHVDVLATMEFGVEGAGTRHHRGMRDMTPAKPYAVQIRNVSNGVSLRYGRVSLDVQNVRGPMSIDNEFGDTRLSIISPMKDVPHRVVSQSGRIDVELSAKAWESTKTVAVTNHGGVRTNVPREQFDTFHLTGTDRISQVRRNWQGFRTVTENEDRMAVFNLLYRFDAIVTDQERTSGLDLFSRSGRIVVMRQ